MKRIIFISLLFLSLFILTGCMGFVVIPDQYVVGYQNGKTYVGATYWNYPGYAYGFSGPICGWNSSGLPLGCNAGPVAPSFQRDMWRSFYGW